MVGLWGVPPHAVADAVDQHQAHERVGHIGGVRGHVAVAGCQVQRRHRQLVDRADEIGLAEIGALAYEAAVDLLLAPGPLFDLGITPLGLAPHALPLGQAAVGDKRIQEPLLVLHEPRSWF